LPVKDATLKDAVGNLLVAYIAPTDDLALFVATALAMHAGAVLCGRGSACSRGQSRHRVGSSCHSAASRADGAL